MHGLRTSLSNAEAVVVEGLEVGEAELGRAESLRVVCKFGTVTDNINVPACERRGVQVQSVRTNIAVAEHSMALMLALVKKIAMLNGQVTAERINAAGRSYRPL